MPVLGRVQGLAKTLEIYDGAANIGWCCDELVLCEEQSDVVLDLRRLRFVGPLFLVRLRAWLDYHAGKGIAVRVLPPASVSVRNYMSRMHLTAGLADAVDFALPAVNENPLADRLIALTRLDAHGNSEFDELLGGLLASPDMRHAGYLAEVVEGAAQEMALNAVDHGANDVGAYVAAQRFRYSDETAPHVCVLAVGDMGVGMAAPPASRWRGTRQRRRHDRARHGGHGLGHKRGFPGAGLPGAVRPRASEGGGLGRLARPG